jgi:uncharacterized protein (DUF1778 family)
LGYFSATLGQAICHFSCIFASLSGKICVTKVATIHHFRARCALLLGEFCAPFGQVLGHFWVRNGSLLGRFWVSWHPWTGSAIHHLLSLPRVPLSCNARRWTGITSREQAAKAREMTITQFILKASLDAAHLVLPDPLDLTTFLPPNLWQKACQRLEQPPQANPALQQLFREQSLWE